MKILHSIKKFLDSIEWLRLSNKKYRLRQYFALYTALFILTCCIVFCWYFLTGRTFIWQVDGWSQHYKALVYYSKYMRSIIRELLYHHRLVFPKWDFAFGEGNDILQSLHYYVIGDPFALFSFFVPTRFMWVYYDAMILLRLYLSGIAFSCLCFYTEKGIGRYAVIAGTLSYVFCHWAILNVNRHPYFLNPMLYFPLILLGIEKLLRKEKPYILIVSVFLASVSNFYYFYVIVLMTTAYVAVRLIGKYKADLKPMLGMLLRIAGGSVLGTMMGGIILVPIAFAFLNDARMGAGNAWHLVYPLSYYSKLLGAFFSGDNGYWLNMGYAAPVILAVFLLFMRRKQHRLLKAYFLVCTVIILFPALGQLLNGISYMSNKWCWAFALLCAYIFTVMWPELMNLKLQDALKLAVALSICFFALLMLEYSRTLAAFACIGIAFIFLIVLFPFQMENPETEKRWKKWKQAVAFLLVILAVANVSFFKNAAAMGNYAKAGKAVKDVVGQLMLTEALAVETVADADGISDFYRYSGRSLPDNGNVLSGISGTQYYWSIGNPYIVDYMKNIESLETMAHRYTGYDDRTALLALSSVLYYVVPSNNKAPLPYGFTYIDEFNVKKDKNATASNYKVYRNDNALPIAYTYDTIISEEAWSKLSAVEKQEAMMQSVFLADYDGETQDNEVDYRSRSLDYSIQCHGTGVTLEDYGFVVTAADSSATVSFEGLTNSETYFSIKGLDFDGVSAYELYFGDKKYDPLNQFTKTRWNHLSYADRESMRKTALFWTKPTDAVLTLKSSSGVSKSINYYTEDYSWYNDRHDFTVNLDYAEDAVTSITITFSKVGIYSFDSIEVICQPMDRHAEQVAALKQHTLKNVNIGTNMVTGTISLDSPKILCLSIPYSSGWTAYVDGEKTTLYQANVKNMALLLKAGEHNVRLVYHTPWLKTGAAISAIGFLGFGAMVLIQICKRQKNQIRV